MVRVCEQAGPLAAPKVVTPTLAQCTGVTPCLCIGVVPAFGPAPAPALLANVHWLTSRRVWLCGEQTWRPWKRIA